MLTKHVDATMRHARYEILADDGTFDGEIPDCCGVYANARSLEECRAELAEVLEDRLIFRIQKPPTLPTIDGLELTVETEIGV
jgi:predicted RNase H-like HicB family nuclease